jgi:hypothetical protein
VAALALTASVQAQNCTFRPGPDVIVGDITGPSNYAANGALEATSLGTTSCNLGDTNLDWISNTNDHPVIGGSLFRLKDYGGWWAFEQVGQSWLKHGFFALSQNLCCPNCASTNGSQLGRGCSDPYTSSRNGSQGGLGPRWQVNAFTGFFNYPPANPSWSGSTARRLEVAISDLESTTSTTTQYYGEAMYVTPDDAAANNHYNNASYRRMSCTGSGSSWNFGFIGGTVRETSAIYAWSAFDPTVQVRKILLPGEGQLSLAYKVTDLGNGTWHYEYALYNLNSHDSARLLSIPIPTGVNVTNIGFHDVTYRNGDGVSNINHDGTDWPGVLAGGALTWETATFASNPNANAVRWSTLYNFRFDANTPPTDVTATVGRFRTGGSEPVPNISGPSAPSAAGVTYCDGNDGSLALCPCGNAGTPDSGCDNAAGTGGVHIAASAFTPDGGGGGTVTMVGTGFPAGQTPSVTLIRSPSRENPPVVFGDGLRCIGLTNLVRVTADLAINGQVSLPVNHGAGAGTFDYQLWYRSNPASYCDPLAAFNLSDAVELVW